MSLGELDSADSLSKNHEHEIDYLSNKILSWRNVQTAAHAADALGAAVVLEREQEVTDIARSLIQNYDSRWKFGHELANHVLDSTDCSKQSNLFTPEFKLKEQHWLIQKYRNLLRLESKDPVTWVDLSLVYASIGVREKAEKCMNVALHLARDNRFVIRSASRLWIHLKDPEKAYQIIVRSNRTKYDPWLLAAEIATGETAEITPKFTTISRRYLDDKKFDSNHLSELASAMATLELGAGNIRKARKYFTQSLEQPTENCVAQATWANHEKLTLRLETESLHNPKFFEAACRSNVQQGDWDNAIDQCWKWLFDQPFSNVPGINGSYLASVVLEDYSTCKEFAEFSLRANPRDPALLNNLAFSQINLNEFADAKNTLSKINIDTAPVTSKVAIKVTIALLITRNGERVAGRKLYEEATNDARKLKDQQLLSHVYTYYALEELSVSSQISNALAHEALNRLKRQNDSISDVLQKRLEATLAQEKL